MIKLNELQFFMKVAELQNMTRAAEVLHVSQPSLSRSIRALEEDLGYSLFDRRGKNSIVLNDYGQIVYKWGQSVFSDLNEMTKELDKHDVEKEDAVNFALCAAASLFPEIMDPFTNKHRMLNLHYGLNAEDIDWDIMIYASLEHISDRYTAELLSERYVAVMSKNHALSSRQVLSLNELQEYPLILVERGKNLRDNIELFFKKYGFRLHNYMVVDSPRVMRERVNETNGITILPEYTWPIPSQLKSKLIAVPFDLEEYRRHIYITRKMKISQSAEELYQYFVEHFAEYTLQNAEQ